MTTTDVTAAADPFAGLQDDWQSASRYLSIFIDEAERTIDELIAALLAFEAGGGRENIKDLFVAAHRLKGSAASIGLERVAKLAHLMEDVLQTLVEDFGSRVTHPIRIDTKLSEAPGVGRTIFEYAPRGRGAADYVRLAELVEEMPPLSAGDR